MSNGNIEALAKALKLDIRILQVKHEIKELPERAAFETAASVLDQLDNELKQAGEQKQTLEANIKKVEQEISAANQKIAQEEKKLFSGMITNSKEADAVQREIDFQKNKNDENETNELEFLQDLDAVNETLAAISGKHAAATEDRDAKQRVYEEALAKLESELDELRTKARDIKQVIEPMILFKYEHISEDKGGVGASFYKEGTCTGCHISLPKDEAAKFLEKHDLGKCSNCKRILIPPDYADV